MLSDYKGNKMNVREDTIREAIRATRRAKYPGLTSITLTEAEWGEQEAKRLHTLEGVLVGLREVRVVYRNRLY